MDIEQIQTASISVADGVIQLVLQERKDPIPLLRNNSVSGNGVSNNNENPAGEIVSAEYVLDGNRSQRAKENTYDTDEMMDKLREVDKERKERIPEKEMKDDGESRIFHPGEMDPADNETYRQALACVPDSVASICFECRVEIAKLLNIHRDDYNDYRLVADSLGFKSFTIDVMNDTPDPAMSLLKICNPFEGQVFVKALFHRGRFDVMRVILKYYKDDLARRSVSVDVPDEGPDECMLPPTRSLNEPMLRKYKLRNFRGGDGAMAKETVSNCGEGGNTDKGEMVTEETDVPEAASSDGIPVEDYRSPESKQLWENIAGHVDLKMWGDVKKAFTELFEGHPFKINLGYTIKLVAHILQINHDGNDTQLCSRQNFCQMVSWFGPAVSDVNGCFQKMFDLMKKSQMKVTRVGVKLVESWFAGRMNENDCALAFEREGIAPGSFAIRFSTSKADEGWFVLAVHFEEHGVIQFQIQHDPIAQQLTFSEKSFNNLPQLVKYFSNEYFSSEYEELLVKPCPRLPLNVICRSYAKAQTSSNRGSNKNQKSRNKVRSKAA